MEDYLEAIYRLELHRGAIRVKALADLMSVKMPSVTSALQKLEELQLITHKKYGDIEFTAEGRKIARQTYQRHQALREFLTDILQLQPADAEREACEMEHAMSGETLRRLLALLDFIKQCPRGGPDWLQHLKDRADGKPCDGDCAKCIHNIQLPEKSPFTSPRDDTDTITLDKLKPGQKACIVRLGGAGPLRRRIMDMGITTGCNLEVERLAPLGDPMEFKIRGYHLSLRREEAASIHVRPQT